MSDTSKRHYELDAEPGHYEIQGADVGGVWTRESLEKDWPALLLFAAITVGGALLGGLVFTGWRDMRRILR
jgi:hypothetical protein